MMKVFIVTYGNNLIEDWSVKGVFLNEQDAQKLKDQLRKKDTDLWSNYEIEEWKVNQ